MLWAGSCTPLNVFSALGAQRETALRVSLQVRHCCLLAAKRRCVAKSQYDTACSWKLRKGAAGCESVRRGMSRMVPEPAAAREGAGMPLTQPGCPSFHLPLCAGLHLHMGCLHVLPHPSASEMAPACLRNYQTTFCKCLLPSQGQGRRRSQPCVPSS